MEVIVQADNHTTVIEKMFGDFEGDVLMPRYTIKGRTKRGPGKGRVRKTVYGLKLATADISDMPVHQGFYMTATGEKKPLEELDVLGALRSHFKPEDFDLDRWED